MNLEESRLLELLAGASPTDGERPRLTRMLLTLEPGETRDRVLTPLLQPVVVGTEPDPVAAAVAETTTRLGAIKPTQVIADRLWNAAVTEGKDPETVGRQLGALLRIGPYNQHRQDVAEDPTVVELRELFLARELISVAVLPAARLAPADLAIRQRRAELHRRLADLGSEARPEAAEPTPQRQLAVALTEIRACADLSVDEFEDVLGQDPGWLERLTSVEQLDADDLARLRAHGQQGRIGALPAWLRQSFMAALTRAERSASHTALDGEQLASAVGQLLVEARTSLDISQAQAARDLGVERHVLRSRERGTSFRTFRGLRLCLDAAERYRGSPRHGELTEALTQYADLLHTERFLQLRSTRETTVDDQTLVVSVMMHSLLRELDVSEERFADTLALAPSDIGDVVRPFQRYTYTEWSTLEAVRNWLGSGDTRLRGTPPREDEDQGGATPGEAWPTQLVGDVAEFAELRRRLNLSADSRASLRTLIIPETITPQATAVASTTSTIAPAEPPTPVSRRTPTQEPSTRRPGAARGRARAPELPSPAAPPPERPSDELWWQVAAALRARFGLPLRHQVKAVDVAAAATDTLPTEALCAVANGEGAALDGSVLNELVAESDRRAPNAASLRWTRPTGGVGDPVTLYAHLLRGWAVDPNTNGRSMTPSQVQYAHRELPMRRGGDVEAALFHLIRGHRDTRDAAEARRGLTNVLLGNDPKQPLDLAVALTSHRPAGSVDNPPAMDVEVGEVQKATTRPEGEPQPGRSPLGTAAETTLVRSASSRTAVWLSEVPIELISDTQLSRITMAGDTASRERYAVRREAARGQTVTYLIGNRDLLPAFAPEAEQPASGRTDPVATRWHRQTLAWLKRTPTVTALAVPSIPDLPAGLSSDFEILTDAHGGVRVLAVEDGQPTLVTDIDQVTEYVRVSDALAAAARNEAPPVREGATPARRPDPHTAKRLESLAGLEGQELRDARLRNWYRNLTTDQHSAVLEEMKATAIERVNRYFGTGEAFSDAEYGRLRQNLRTAQRRASPARLELTARQLEAVFTWARDTEDPAAVQAAALIRDAIAELDNDLTREILETTVIGEATTEDYARDSPETLQNLRSRRSVGVQETDAIIGWLPAADLAAVRSAVKPATDHVAEKRTATKRAETERGSLRAQKRRQVAAALTALGEEVDATDRATVAALVAHPTDSMDTIGKLLDPPVTGSEVTRRMNTLVRRAGLTMPGARTVGSGQSGRRTTNRKP